MEIYPEELAGVSALQKVERIAEQLRSQGHGAAVICDPTSLMWLLNVRGGDVATLPVTLGHAIVDANAEVALFTATANSTPACCATAASNRGTTGPCVR